jgi:recombination protein RecT
MTANSNTAVATTTEKAISKFQMRADAAVGNRQTLQAMLEAHKDKFAEVLPRVLTVKRLLKAAAVACINTPKLLECSQISILNSVMKAASLGLDVSGTLGGAYLIPYGKTCQLIIGYRGLIDLARRSGEISTIEAHLVYKQDRFDLRYGTDAKIEHVPYLGEDRREEYLAVYAVATLKDGTKQTEVMTIADVHRIQNMSRSASLPDSPWKNHWGEMARKTVVRRIAKYLPLTVELAEAIEADDDRGDPRPEVLVTDARDLSGDELNRTAALAERLAPGESAGNGEHPEVEGTATEAGTTETQAPASTTTAPTADVPANTPAGASASPDAPQPAPTPLAGKATNATGALNWLQSVMPQAKPAKVKSEFKRLVEKVFPGVAVDDIGGGDWARFCTEETAKMIVQ